MTQMSSMMMSQPLASMSSFPNGYLHYNHAGNPTFPSQDFMLNYNSNYSSVPFTNPNCVDTEPKLDLDIQPDK